MNTYGQIMRGFLVESFEEIEQMFKLSPTAAKEYQAVLLRVEMPREE